MQLRNYEKADANIIAAWFTNADDVFRWAADNYQTYPLTGDAINANYDEKGKGKRFIPLTATDEDGTVLGHFIIRYPNDDDDSTVRFGFVVVDPALRGKGYGAKMLTCGIDYVREKLGAKRIELGVFANNPAAQKCYASLGFKEYHRRDCEVPSGTWEIIDEALEIE